MSNGHPVHRCMLLPLHVLTNQCVISSAPQTSLWTRKPTTELFRLTEDVYDKKPSNVEQEATFSSTWESVMRCLKPANRPTLGGAFTLFYQISHVPINHGNVPLFCTNAEKNYTEFMSDNLNAVSRT